MMLTCAEKLRIWSLGDTGLPNHMIAYKLNQTRGFTDPLITYDVVSEHLLWLRKGRV